MARILAGLVVAIVAVACGPVPEFEPGSTEETLAALIAEWGPGEYREILEARDCEALERWRDNIERHAETVPDTPQWRGEQGRRQALSIREAQLGCSASY